MILVDHVQALPVPRRGPYHAHAGGFDLHAGVCVPTRDRARLERLCRHALRSPVAADAPEPGEMYGKEALDRWIAVLARISDEAYSTPEIVKTSPHNQATHRLKPGETDDPSKRAMTWRAFQKKRVQTAEQPVVEVAETESTRSSAVLDSTYGDGQAVA